MKLLCLGAGFMQINAIKKARQKGYTVVVSDYLPDAPGKKWAHHSELTSTFDVEGNIRVARKHDVDGVFTIGTDQPVLTVAQVAEALDLPHMISSWTALRATNKKYMKEVFAAAGIPCSKQVYIERQDLAHMDTILDKLTSLNFPVVVKPLDSQGQRGIYKIYEPDSNILDYLHHTFNFTRGNEIIVEEFFSGDEITISAWVEDFHPYILMITDRPLLNVEPHLGIPDGHVFPSRYGRSHASRITRVVEQIVSAFNIRCGPLYIQMMVNGEQLQVVEIACRIGGGHEEELIPLVTGIDVVDMLIDKAAGQPVNIETLKHYNLLDNPNYAMVKFVIARPGMVDSTGDLTQALSLPGVVNAGFYKPAMQEVKELVDSTCRIGYILVKGSSHEDVKEKVSQAYNQIKVFDSWGKNMVVDTSRSNGYYQIYKESKLC